MYVLGCSSDYEKPNKGVSITKDRPNSHEMVKWEVMFIMAIKLINHDFRFDKDWHYREVMEIKEKYLSGMPTTSIREILDHQQW